MNTTDLIKIVSNRLKITQSETRRLVRLTFNTISNNLEKQEMTVIRGFGSFGTRLRKPRKSYHPTLKRRMVLPPKSVIYFRPSKALKEKFSARRK